MRRILKRLQVIQEKTINKDSRFTIRKVYRVNPYNPLSYITIITVFVVGIILFGVVGFWSQIKLENPFKYN